MLDLKTAILGLKMSLQKHYDEEFKQLSGHCNVILRDYNEEFEEFEETIGEIEFSLHHLSKYDEELQNLYFEIDAQSEDKTKLVTDFLHFLEETDQFDCYSFITIDTMRIQKEYRSSGLGEKALRELLDLGRYMNVDYFILQPAPIDTIEDENRIKQIKQIARFYEKVGFKCYQRKNKESIMIYNEWFLGESVNTFIQSKDIDSNVE